MSIYTHREATLEYLASRQITCPHCFTTRYGGVSTGHLSSMNLGTSRGDDIDRVIENYRILGRSLGFDPERVVLSRQTHSDIVRCVGEEQWGAGLFTPPLSECDALITNTPGTALMVFTADCTPILFYDPVTGAVGAAHAGWRGTASAIAAKTVEAMVKHFGSRPEDLCCAIGPNIGQCCFETDADVPDSMIASLGSEASQHIRRQGVKYHINLKELNAMVLRRSGVRHIDICNECTMCQSHRFWSHRVTGQRRGSQGGLIVCKEGSK